MYDFIVSISITKIILAAYPLSNSFYKSGGDREKTNYKLKAISEKRSQHISINEQIQQPFQFPYPPILLLGSKPLFQKQPPINQDISIRKIAAWSKFVPPICSTRRVERFQVTNALDNVVFPLLFQP